MAHTMDAGAGGYDRQVGMGEAVKLFFTNYIKFEGRSNRGEYWWAFLAIIIISFVLGLIDGMLGIMVLGTIFSLATLIPGIAIGVRRLHDIDKSGWWLLIGLIPVIGFFVLIYFFIQKPTPGPNRFG
ncbi:MULTISPECIES: DUF805 domain-containing protein [Mameliella]|uniref:Putative membrane protein n=1 Tax=Mameliella alba TaxID=561184 RepID=A0A0B3SIX5_9RHOB|nr:MULTISPECIES: DUF805 domain-containing protein [Mameliella]MCR9275471.1 DUF805 domain-containing protein [Paracoccaceae bacterium]KHQ50494.1 putative membrane protein [Mameliella alba]MBY6122518.1 DUF805 domain-containing protein [Mameliella alba]OWV41580.1 DUF805 domain-containing protein [Mameliella alba]OWV54655.1 DUF805 domain-containing protein [Mameliella alba]